jgi:hypothetical protein
MTNDQAPMTKQIRSTEGSMFQMRLMSERMRVVSLAAALGFVVLAGCGHSAASPVAAEPASSAAAANAAEGEVAKEESRAGKEESVATESAKAPAAKPPRGQPPPADRMPSRPGEAEKITFDDLNIQMQADVVFRPIMLNDRVTELEGKRISISGYMHGGQLSQRGITKFVLLKNTECKFGPGGQADHLAQVFLREGTKTDYTNSAVKVEGTLKVVPFEGPDGNTWSIYNLEDARMR